MTDTPVADAATAPIGFIPVPSRTNRHNGWTPERQRRFIDALGKLGLVAPAAAEVGMSAKSAYALRNRPGAGGFAAAWDAALAQGRLVATHLAVHRAVHGVAVPVFYRGRQIGERRVYNDRLLLTALRRFWPRLRGVGIEDAESDW